jgi:hypothetical protein
MLRHTQDLFIAGPEFEMGPGPEPASPVGVRLSSVISPMRMSPLLEQEEEEQAEEEGEREAETAPAAAKRRVKPRIGLLSAHI